MWRRITRAFRCAERLIEAMQRARADPQDEFVHVGDEIVDRTIGAADLAGQIAGFQTRQPPLSDNPLGRLDQVGPKFRSTFQGLSHLESNS